MLKNTLHEYFIETDEINNDVTLMMSLCGIYLKVVRRTIDKKTVEVFQLFNEELNLVKKEFNTKTVALPPMYPKYAGSATWARALKRRIDRDRKSVV